MIQKTVEFRIKISLNDIQKSPYGYGVTKSIYPLKGGTMYIVEAEMVKQALTNAGLKIENVTTVAYESGIGFKPYGFTGSAAMSTDYYLIILRVLKFVVPDVRQQILLQFRTTNNPTKLYRELAMKYHPDKGGDIEIMKYVNSLKERYK
jgi:hypothetical protein